MWNKIKKFFSSLTNKATTTVAAVASFVSDIIFPAIGEVLHYVGLGISAVTPTITSAIALVVAVWTLLSGIPAICAFLGAGAAMSIVFDDEDVDVLEVIMVVLGFCVAPELFVIFLAIGCVLNMTQLVGDALAA